MKINLLAALLLCQSAIAAEDAAELANLLPVGANAVTIVRVADLLETDRAQAEDWTARQEERFLSGAAAVPPWVGTLVIGSLVHPSVPEEVWSAAAVRLPDEMTLEQIAEREQAPVEEIAGQPAVRSHCDSYLIQLFSGTLGVYRPAHRLEASRWVRSVSDGQRSSITSYLKDATRAEGHVVMAIDLQDLLDQRQVEQLLKEDQRFASHRRLVGRLVPLLSGLRGVTFSATIGDTTQATVTIHLSDDVGPSSQTIKTLFLSTLDDLGARIDEFAVSRVRSEGESVVLTCELSDESLRRILSLVISSPCGEYQSSVPPSPRVEKPPQRRTADPQRESQQYLKAVNKMIDDLARANRRATDYDRTAAWHDNFARKIEELQTGNVDRRLLVYGQTIASRFRALAASLRGQGIDVNAQQQTLTYDVDYNPGWASVGIWGGVGYRAPSWNVRSNLQEVRERQATAVSAGSRDREQIWQFIRDDRAKAEMLLKN